MTGEENSPEETESEEYESDSDAEYGKPQSRPSDDGAKKIAPPEYFEQSSRWSRQSRQRVLWEDFQKRLLRLECVL